MSGISSWLWGTSQLDDAVGEHARLLWSPSFTQCIRQGDVRATAIWGGRHCAQSRDMRPDKVQVGSSEGRYARAKTATES